MTAIALDGSIYIELHDPPDVRKERRNRQSAHAVQTYMGYSYESFSTVPAPDRQEEMHEGDPESWSGDVNTNVQVRHVLRQSVGVRADNGSGASESQVCVTGLLAHEAALCVQRSAMSRYASAERWIVFEVCCPTSSAAHGRAADEVFHDSRAWHTSSRP